MSNNINTWFPGQLVDQADMLTVNKSYMGTLQGANKVSGAVFGVVPTIDGGGTTFSVTQGMAFFGETADTTYISKTGTNFVYANIPATGALPLVSPNCYIYVKYTITYSGDNKTTIVTPTVYSSTNASDVGVKICDVVSGKPINYDNNNISNYFKIQNNTMSVQNPDGSPIEFLSGTDVIPYILTSQWTAGQERIIASLSGAVGATGSLVGGVIGFAFYSQVANYSMGAFLELSGPATGGVIQIAAVGGQGSPAYVATPQEFTSTFAIKSYSDVTNKLVIFTATPSTSVPYTSGDIFMEFINNINTGTSNFGNSFVGQLKSAYTPTLTSPITYTDGDNLFQPVRQTVINGTGLKNTFDNCNQTGQARLSTTNAASNSSLIFTSIDNSTGAAVASLRAYLAGVEKYSLSLYSTGRPQVYENGGAVTTPAASNDILVWDDFPLVFSGSGEQTLASGLIIKWGTFSSGIVNANQWTFNFPTPFPNSGGQCMFSGAMVQGATIYPAFTVSTNTTSATVGCPAAPAPASGTFYNITGTYIAFGK